MTKVKSSDSNFSKNDYRLFFIELFKAEYLVTENPQGTQKVLEQNIEKLNETFLKYFPDFCDELIRLNSRNKVTTLILNISIKFHNFCNVNIQINKEIAISGFHFILPKITENPEKYAIVQNNLGLAYYSRKKGAKVGNLEQAITCHENALTIYAQDSFPEQWAMTQNNLGNAYLERIKGSKADNLEQAITCYENALTIYAQDSFPEQWAMTQNNLGNAYLERIKGSKADNLENAITYFKSALTILIENTFSEQWATTQNNLGNAYRKRIKGSKADNLEQAITCLQNTLTIYTQDTFPYKWATTQNNLAAAYSERINGSKVDNLENAIACFKSALTVRTSDSFPEQWAMTQNNLGLAYSERIKGSKADNLESAINCYKKVLTVLTKDSFPQDWAMTQNNLGNAYYEQAKIKDQDENLINQAIQSFRDALTIRKSTDLPEDCLESSNNLGNLGFDTENWAIAKEGYELAIQAVETMCGWSPMTEQKRLRENNLSVYEKMILACLNSDDLATALLTVERSKSRSVVQMLTNTEVQPKNATPEQLERLQILRRQYLSFFPVSNDDDQDNTDAPPDQTTDQSTDRETRQVEISQPSQSPNDQQQRELEQQLNQLLEEINDPEFSLTQKIQPIELSEIQDFLNENTVILDWYILEKPENGWLTLIITKNNIQIKHFTDAEQYETLQQWQIEYFQDYQTEYYARENKQWSEQLTNRLEQLSKILGINEILQTIPAQYQQLILIPHQFLHIFPLHALPAQCPDTTGNLQTGCLMELFPQGVHYMPNCRLLERLHQREKNIDQTATGRLFAIQNPDNNLPYANVEVQTISQQIQNQFHIDPTILIKAEANKTRLFSPEILAILKQAKYLHFACHGKFNQKKPLYSALKLAKELDQTSNAITNQTPDQTIPVKEDRLLTLRDGGTFDPLIEGLTMQEIVAKLDLPQALLVILSACETGLIKWETIDEYIGLPTGFLLAGALRVISSNWPVDDFVTAFLMVRAYYNYLSGEYTISQSLQQAQIWFKNVTREKFIDWLRDDLKYSEADWQKCQTRIKRDYKGNQPFNHLKYWASFNSIGLA